MGHYDDQRKHRCPEEQGELFDRHHPMAFLYLGLTGDNTSDLSTEFSESTMNPMSALRLHASEQLLQSQADADFVKPTETSQSHEFVTRARINEILPTLRAEQRVILTEYLQKLTTEQERDVLGRLNDLCEMAEKTFAPLLRTFEGTPTNEQLQEFESRFFQWMALVMPYVGEKSQWLQSVEETTGLQNINHGEHMWTSQVNNTFLTSEQVIGNPNLKRDTEGWQGSSGLLIHTAAAAWGIERFVKIIQDNMTQMEAKGMPLTKEQKERMTGVLELDPRTMRIWLLFHDAMRTLSHDTFVHAAALPLFGKLMNLPEEYLKDFDLPEILGFMHPDPEKVNGAGNMQSGLPPFKVENYMRDNPELLMQMGGYYIERLLELLKEKNVDDTPNEGILFFWIIDAYSKLQPVTELKSSQEVIPAHKSNFAFPSQASVESQLEQRLADLQAEETADGVFPTPYYEQTREKIDIIRQSLTGIYKSKNFNSSNRQPNDTNDFFLGRLFARLMQGSQNDQEMYLYYSRQNDMAFAVFDWIRLMLNMDKEDLWKFFFELTEISHKMLDENDQFVYQYTPTEDSPLGWNTDKSSSRSRNPTRFALSSTLAKETVQTNLPG